MWWTDARFVPVVTSMNSPVLRADPLAPVVICGDGATPLRMVPISPHPGHRAIQSDAPRPHFVHARPAATIYAFSFAPPPRRARSFAINSATLAKSSPSISTIAALASPATTM